MRTEAAGTVGAQLESTRAQVLAARQGAGEDTEQAWWARGRLRVQELSCRSRRRQPNCGG